MRTVAHKFPRYSLEDLLDKTPAALQYLTLQAVKLDMDMADKLSAILGGSPKANIPGPRKGPKVYDNLAEENAALRSLGGSIGR